MENTTPRAAPIVPNGLRGYVIDLHQGSVSPGAILAE
jgi:hypothetical protein